MKKLFFALAILLFSIQTFSQVEANDVEVLQTLFAPYGQAPIAYIDSALPYNSTLFFEKLNQDTITNYNNSNFIILSEQEKELLRVESQKNNQSCWDPNLFTNSILVKKDSMWSFLEAKRIQLIGLQKQNYANQDTALKNLAFDRSQWLFAFSKPIFLRDDTICLVNFIALIGKIDGDQQLAFYRKENGQWKCWIIINSGSW